MERPRPADGNRRPLTFPVLSDFVADIELSRSATIYDTDGGESIADTN